MTKPIGIDLGTTNSCMATIEGGEPVVIPNSEGGRTTPSIVAFTSSGERLVGAVAKRQAITNPEHTITSIKRKMGTAEKKKIDANEYTPQEISAMILQKLKSDAEAFLGHEVKQAVITVPAYFDDSQRQATKDAGTIAGLEVLRIINEPTAAALAYGFAGDQAKEETILVFDLGGGTFDVSVLDIGEGVFEVKATHGDMKLGGDDWDQRVIDWMADSFKATNGVDLRQDKMALQRLKEAAEKAKCELSTVTQTNINLPFVTATNEGPLHLDMNLSRSEFERMTEDLLKRCEGPFKKAMEDAGVTAGDLAHVILVGGSTRMPAVQELVKGLTGGKEPNKSVNPDEVVAVGAAIQAGVLRGEVKDILLLDVTPLTLGIETKGGIATHLIERNTTIPTRKSEVFSTAEDGQNSVEIHVLQGERPMAADNKTLGKFQLVGIPPAPRGLPQIEVTFDIDADGITHVSAKDLGTGNEQKITIKASTNLEDNDIERMVDEAKAHAEDDKRKKEEAETRNQADQAIYSTEKSMKEAGDKVPADLKAKLDDAIAQVKSALEGSDVAKIKSAAEALSEASYPLATLLYEQAQQAAGSQGDAGAGANADEEGEEEDIVEAEVVDE